jgi:hypothetical protein
MSNEITVSTVAASNLPVGFVQVTAKTKTTTGGPTLQPQDRQRCILIPELILEGLPSKFMEFTRAALHEAAREQLATLWKEQGAALKTVHPALFSVDGLLAWAGRVVESRRLSGDTIKAALAETGILTAIGVPAQRQDEAIAILASFAGPSKLGNEKQLRSLSTKLANWLEQPGNDSSVVELLIPKINTRVFELEELRKQFETSDGF